MRSKVDYLITPHKVSAGIDEKYPYNQRNIYVNKYKTACFSMIFNRIHPKTTSRKPATLFISVQNHTQLEIVRSNI